MTLAQYRKAWMAAGVSAVTGAAASIGLLLYDWAPDAKVDGPALRWAVATFVVGLINGSLSAYGVAVIPNAPPASTPRPTAVKRPSIHPTLVELPEVSPSPNP